MPKRVDHERRRRELADAVWRVVAREGIEGTSLQLVADAAGWSVGSMRHYFATKAELLIFALRLAGDRIGERIANLPARPTAMGRLRAVIAEQLPLDAARREEALVWLAFIARAPVDDALAPAAQGAWRQLRDPLVAHIAEAVGAGELPPRLDVGREASRLQALIDGLVVHMVSAPRHVPPDVALSLVDHHLATLGVDAARDPAERPAADQRPRPS